MSARDLADTTYALSRPWWDPVEHMVWNPPGSFEELAPPRSLHLVPQTAWLAYAQLARGDDEGIAAIEKLISLQYDQPGSVVHGTYRRFLEQPALPAEPVLWDDYDPNWRQFVGTTFAVVLEDFGATFAPDLVGVIEQSIHRACVGEPDHRIPVSYANPALMRAWLDAWCGTRLGDKRLVERGRAFAREIVAAFDEFQAFDEFNSPTYYGIDVYALRLWQTFAPDEYFASEGARIEAALWMRAADFYNARLRNYCGPFTRSYDPDANRSVALLSLWIWAYLGRDLAPLPSLDSARVDHCHDLMAGALFARLANGDIKPFERPRRQRVVRQQLPHGRVVTAWIADDVMLGAEASDLDWGGWAQFMPVTAHWSDDDGRAALWMLDPRTVRARADEGIIEIEVPDSVSELRFRVGATTRPAPIANGLRVSGFDVTVEGASAPTRIEPADDDLVLCVAVSGRVRLRIERSV